MAEARRTVSAPKGMEGSRLLIVEARYYDDIGEMLFTGAKRAAEAAGCKVDVIQVPGALEIPAAIAMATDHALDALDPYDGAVALGCVIRGETYHFEIVAGESSRAIMDLTIHRQLPIGNGILTVENEEQARVRANPDEGDKGGDAVRAALSLAAIKRGTDV